jgi:hypothetical protein
MTTIDKTVAASSDDATENSSQAISLALNPSTVVDNPTEFFAARWDISDAPIPAGATITACTITCEFPDGLNDEPLHAMQFQEAAAPLTFAAVASNISSRPRTAASVTWDNANLGAPGDFTSPDMSAVLQEVVDSQGELTAIVWILEGSGTSSRDFVITTYDGTPAKAARLHVEYTIGGAGGAGKMHYYRQMRA